MKFMCWRMAGLVVVGLLVMLFPAVAQKPEIYLGPIDNDPLPPTVSTPVSPLAKCLRNPDDVVSCASANAASTEAGLESAVAGQLQFPAYVACSDAKGVCLELATLDLGSADVANTLPAERLASVAVNIAFDLDSAFIRASEERKLAQLAAAMLHPDNRGASFAVIGHTDAMGTAVYNCGLSRRRAAVVAERLAALDVPSSRLQPLGVGFHVPHNRADGLAPENRRVGFAPMTDERRNLSRSASKDDADPMLRKLLGLCQG